MFEFYVIYLRKSRADDPTQSVEEVLEKHETMLQEYAVREFGGRIPEENIYREVVSGESIEERVEIQKVLARIEDPKIKGVLVVEPQRLSRGDLEDCGKLISDFRYTRTQVVTPMMTYNLENKMERKFFQDELLRGRDYLEYTKEILMRGRIAAIKRGCYISQNPPFGYSRVKIGKDHTLEINEAEAEVVRLIFDWYANEGLSPGMIARKLNDMNVPSGRCAGWSKEAVRRIVRNKHYIGLVTFNNRKAVTTIENGEKVIRHLLQPEEEVIVAEGKHQAIIDLAVWEKAQNRVASNPRVKHTHELKNPFSGVVKCSKCGKTLHLAAYKNTENRFQCRTVDGECFKTIKFSVLENAVIAALELAELPALKLKVKNGDGDALKIQQRLVGNLEKQLTELLAQEEKQFEFLETGLYTPDVFEKRHTALRHKLEDCREQLYKAKASMPKSVDYAEKVVLLESAVAILKDKDATPLEKNKILKAIVQEIKYYGPPRGTPRGQSPITLEVFLRL